MPRQPRREEWELTESSLGPLHAGLSADEMCALLGCEVQSSPVRPNGTRRLLCLDAGVLIDLLPGGEVERVQLLGKAPVTAVYRGVKIRGGTAAVLRNLGGVGVDVVEFVPGYFRLGNGPVWFWLEWPKKSVESVGVDFARPESEL